MPSELKPVAFHPTRKRTLYMTEPSSMQTEVVRQHTVPRFLLEHFGSSGKKKKHRKQLFAFDKQSGRVFATNVNDATVRNTFYNFDNHPDNLSLEPMLCEYEGRAASVITKILQNKSLSFLSQVEKYDLAMFTAIQQMRTHNQHEQIKHISHSFKKKLLEMGLFDQWVDEFPLSPDTEFEDVLQIIAGDASEAKGMFLEMLSDQHTEADILMQKDWHLLETTLNAPFYISDNPVSLFNGISHPGRGNLGLALEGIEIYLPLSSTITLAMICPSLGEKVRQERAMIQHCIVNNIRINGHNLFDELKRVNELLEGDVIRVDAARVEHLNWLQTWRAEQYIYCQTDNFDLVRKILTESPVLKTGPRMTLS